MSWIFDACFERVRVSKYGLVIDCHAAPSQQCSVFLRMAVPAQRNARRSIGATCCNMSQRPRTEDGCIDQKDWADLAEHVLGTSAVAVFRLQTQVRAHDIEYWRPTRGVPRQPDTTGKTHHFLTAFPSCDASGSSRTGISQPMRCPWEAPSVSRGNLQSQTRWTLV